MAAHRRLEATHSNRRLEATRSNRRLEATMAARRLLSHTVHLRPSIRRTGDNLHTVDTPGSTKTREDRTDFEMGCGSYRKLGFVGMHK